MINQSMVESDKLYVQRERFMSLALPVRLGELAESLAFARTASDHPKYPKFLRRLLYECQNYIDWIAAEVDHNVQSELAELRSHLAAWLCDLQGIEDDPLKRALVAAALGDWSQKIIERSGLADYDDWRTEFDYPPGIRAAVEAIV